MTSPVFSGRVHWLFGLNHASQVRRPGNTPLPLLCSFANATPNLHHHSPVHLVVGGRFGRGSGRRLQSRAGLPCLGPFR